jgi:nucleoside-diphosphate-sugar epimerase
MFTVLGASGFVGSNLVSWLQSQQISCWAPTRDETWRGKPLGHVIYCIGLTADFRERPFDTVQAHVCLLSDILEHADFESFLYLSTTRMYAGLSSASEDSILGVNPNQPDHIYNISKIMGESLCLASGRSGVRVARLSNVYGRDFSSNNFLASVVKEVVRTNRLLLRTSMMSEKDYVSINDVVSLLPQIALFGKHQIYNIASGANTSHAALTEKIQQVTGCAIEIADNAPTILFPRISIDRVREEFNFQPSHLLDSLVELIAEYQRAMNNDKN